MSATRGPTSRHRRCHGGRRRRFGGGAATGRGALLVRGILALASAGLWRCQGYAIEGTCKQRTRFEGCQGPRTSKEFLRLTDPSIYDSSERPECQDGGPVVVEVQLRLTQVNNIDQKLGIISINGYFRTWWTDTRLAFNGTHEGGCADAIGLSETESASIWKPDLMVDNRAGAPDVELKTLTEITHEGVVWRSEQLMMEIKNDLSLGKLPYDTHTGTLIVVSYSQDIESLRLLLRGGALDGTASGIGLVAGPISSQVWEFTEDAEEFGFETQGECKEQEIYGGRKWDYCYINFPFQRMPRYYITEIMFPCLIFLLVAYMQFFVDPAAAPARAALATIPLLIMRTLSNHVYSQMPEGSQKMWLADVLNVYTTLCSLAAVEFGVVQFALMIERDRTKQHHGLLSVKEKARLLIEHAKSDGVPLLELLDRCKAIHLEVPMSLGHQRGSMGVAARMIQNGSAVFVSALGTSFMRGGSTNGGKADDRSIDGGLEVQASVISSSSLPPAGATMTSEPSILQLEAKLEAAGVELDDSQDATESDREEALRFEVKRHESDRILAKSVKESDLLFIRYVHQIFCQYDADKSNTLEVCELRKALRHYNIYVSQRQVEKVIVMFLVDIGESHHGLDGNVRLSFSQFCSLLLDIDKYMLSTERWSLVHLVQSSPPSKNVDMLFRVSYPGLVLFMQILLYCLLDTY